MDVVVFCVLTRSEMILLILVFCSVEYLINITFVLSTGCQVASITSCDGLMKLLALAYN